MAKSAPSLLIRSRIPGRPQWLFLLPHFRIAGYTGQTGYCFRWAGVYLCAPIFKAEGEFSGQN
jgi:hypothetical protein